MRGMQRKEERQTGEGKVKDEGATEEVQRVLTHGAQAMHDGD